MLKIGVPFDVCWNLVEGGMEAEAMAYIVTSGELEGGNFDWDNMSWKKTDGS